MTHRRGDLCAPKMKRSPFFGDLGPLTTQPDSLVGPIRAATAAAIAKIDVQTPPYASRRPAAAGTAPNQTVGIPDAAAHRANRPDNGYRDHARDKAIVNSRGESPGTRPAAACRTGTVPRASSRSD